MRGASGAQRRRSPSPKSPRAGTNLQVAAITHGTLSQSLPPFPSLPAAASLRRPLGMKALGFRSRAATKRTSSEKNATYNRTTPTNLWPTRRKWLSERRKTEGDFGRTDEEAHYCAHRSHRSFKLFEAPRQRKKKKNWREINPSNEQLHWHSSFVRGRLRRRHERRKKKCRSGASKKHEAISETRQKVGLRINWPVQRASYNPRLRCVVVCYGCAASHTLSMTQSAS